MTKEAEQEESDLEGLTEEEAEAMQEANEEEEQEAEAKEQEIREAIGEGEKKEEEEPSKEAAQDNGPAPLLNGELPEGYDDKIKELGESKKSLVTEFDDGDITASEYQEKLDEINRQEREMEQAAFKSQIAKEMEENQQKQQWMNTVNSFLDNHKEYRESELRYQALDMLVKQIANNPDNASMTGDQILSQAHTRIMSEFGQGKVEAPNGSNGKKPKTSIPPTLSAVPAADVTDTGNSKFKTLDRLAEADPFRYEKAVDSLDEEEFERYANDSGA